MRFFFVVYMLFHSVLLLGQSGGSQTTGAETVLISQGHLSASVVQPKNYNFSLSADAAQLYRLTLLNADGLEHLAKTCSGGFVVKLLCEVNNLLAKAYIAIYRVDSATVIVNGVPLSTASQSASLLTSQTIKFESTIRLQSLNSLVLKISGLPTAYVQFKIQSIGPAPNSNPLLLSHFILPAATTYLNQLPGVFEVSFDSDQPMKSASLNSSPMTLSNGGLHASHSIALSAAGNLSLNYEATSFQGIKTQGSAVTRVVLDQIKPVLVIQSGPIYTTQSLLNFPVSVTDQSPVLTDVYLNDVKVFTSNASQILAPISFFADGTYNLKIISTDAAGNKGEAVLTLIRDTMPLALNVSSPPENTSLRPGVFEVRFEASRELVRASIGGVLVKLSDDQKSGKLLMEYLSEGPFSVNVFVEDRFGVLINRILTINFKYDQAPVWTYQECSVNE